MSLSGASSNNQNQLEKLYKLKCQKIKEQKQLSDEASDILNELNKSNAQTRKNLAVAIAVSKRPGYFEYYNPPSNVVSFEKNSVLKKLSSQITILNREIESITNEINEYEKRLKERNDNTVKPTVNNISQWFDVYGKPKLTPETVNKKTNFIPNNKIYGGTMYYKSFKTLSTTMQKGRLL